MYSFVLSWNPRAIAFGHLIERQGLVEVLAGADRSVTTEFNRSWHVVRTGSRGEKKCQ
jgi:hypothetical protein